MLLSVMEEEITKLREAGYLAANIKHRLLDAGQIVPTPEPHERVVFLAHFIRGLGFHLHQRESWTRGCPDSRTIIIGRTPRL